MKKSKKDNQLRFIFKYSQLQVDVNPEAYDDEDREKIEQAVKLLSREIHIDRTYVDNEIGKYQKTFLYSDGWSNLCSLLKLTNYGKDVTKEQNDTIQEAYRSIIIAYAYQFVEDIGYDISDIEIEFEPETQFTVEIYQDIISHDNYKGKWQDWDEKVQNII